MDLLNFIPRHGGTTVMTRPPYPVVLTIEERRTYRVCPMIGNFTTTFTCFQCDRYELHSNDYSEATKCSGRCVYPKKATKLSRERTTLFQKQIRGEISCQTTIESLRALRSQRARQRVSSRSPKGQGLTAKLSHLVSVLKDNPAALKDVVQENFVGKFGNISSAYFNTLWYQARSELNKDQKEFLKDKKAKQREQSRKYREQKKKKESQYG